MPPEDARPLRIRAARGIVEVPRSRLYMAFADGRFAYDCPSCGALCCKGRGYSSDVDRELPAQLTARPELALFLRRGNSRRSVLTLNCAPQCFFLTPDARCGLHVSHGSDAKPETCRLFPFNNLRLCGDYLVVMPHPGLCPLTVVASGLRSSCSQHDALYAEFSRFGVTVSANEADLVMGPSDDAVAHERTCLAEIERTLDTGDVDALLAELWRMDIGRASGKQPSTQAEGGPRSAITAYSYLLGPRPELGRREAEFARTFLSVVPSLRARLVFVVRSDAWTPPLIDRAAVGAYCAATYEVVLRAAAAGVAPVTYQTVMQLSKSFSAVLWLLSVVDRPMRLCSTARVPLDLPGGYLGKLYVQIIKQLLASNVALPLIDLLAPIGRLEGRQRVRALTFIAERLAGRLVAADSAPAHEGSSDSAFRIRLERAGFRTLGVSALRLMSSSRLRARVFA